MKSQSALRAREMENGLNIVAVLEIQRRLTNGRRRYVNRLSVRSDPPVTDGWEQTRDSFVQIASHCRHDDDLKAERESRFPTDEIEFCLPSTCSCRGRSYREDWTLCHLLCPLIHDDVECTHPSSASCLAPVVYRTTSVVASLDIRPFHGLFTRWNRRTTFIWQSLARVYFVFEIFLFFNIDRLYIAGQIKNKEVVGGGSIPRPNDPLLTMLPTSVMITLKTCRRWLLLPCRQQVQCPL